ncbi:MAG: hypothetical protein AAF587_17825 [Bacteroidota bacterium]
MDNLTSEQIYAYLDGKLSGEELLAFEQLMEQQADIRLAVEQALQTKVAAYQEGRRVEKEKLNARWATEDSSANIRNLSLWKVAVAAGIALLLLFALFQFSSESNQGQEMFLAFYEQPVSLSPRNVQELPQLPGAHALFHEEKYEEAAEEYIRLLDGAPAELQDEIRFYLGISSLQLDQLPEAISAFNSLSSSYFGGAGAWYKALVYVKQESWQEAKETCEDILASRDDTYHQQARELLEQLPN